MKRKDKTTEVKCTDFANTIYQIRMEKKLTQKDLADLIGVSDRTISKWENGTTVPDLETIKRLCKALGTSPDSIVKSKKNYKDVLYDFKRRLCNILNYLLKNIFLISFVITFILLLTYFINNYNTIRIYDLTYDNENISFEDGYFFKTKVLNIITINDIKLNKIIYEPKTVKIELYTYLNGDKYVIYESDKLDNIYIEESKSYTDLLTKDVIENIKHNLYIGINTTDEDDNEYSYKSKLVLKQKLNNNKLYYKEYVKEQDKGIENLGLQNPFLVPMTNEYDDTKSDKAVINSTNRLESLGFTYNSKTETYIKFDTDGGIIEYFKYCDILKYTKIENDMIYCYSYHQNYKRIDLQIFNETNEKEKLKITYFVTSPNKFCNKEVCKNYKKVINHILSIYNKITKILQ